MAKHRFRNGRRKKSKNPYAKLPPKEALRRKNFVAQINSGLVLRGNSYEVKDQLQGMGCVWSTRDHCWYAPTERVRLKAQALIDAPSISTCIKTAQFLQNRRPQLVAADPGQKQIYPSSQSQGMEDLKQTYESPQGVNNPVDLAYRSGQARGEGVT